MSLKKKEEHFRVLCLGDVVGRPGREALNHRLRRLRDGLSVDFVVVNGENAAGGSGIDSGTAKEIRSAGGDLITLGDHAFHRKGSSDFIGQNSSWCIRPVNFAAPSPGAGFSIVTLEKITVAVVNFIGRTFINGSQSCPFIAIDEVLEQLNAEQINIVICDFHAEATSEKYAMARYLDGRVGLLFGTHTHVQTSDTQILPQGTAYITDLGMCGSIYGVIGMKSEVAIRRFTTSLPAPYEVAEGESRLSGVVVDFDISTGRAVSIELLQAEYPFEKASPSSSQP